jgi:hypothetical protein
LDFGFEKTYAYNSGNHLSKIQCTDPRARDWIANGKKLNERVTTSLSQSSTTSNTSNLVIACNNASTRNTSVRNTGFSAIFTFVVLSKSPRILTQIQGSAKGKGNRIKNRYLKSYYA